MDMERGQDERAPDPEPSPPEAQSEPTESLSHSFIVKIWIEETAAEAGSTMWRGHITHVTTHARRYFEHLDQIPAFIAPYLQELDITLMPPGK